MTRRQKDPMRPLTKEERRWLTTISRSQMDPAIHVARAKALLAVADGQSYTTAAQTAGRRSGDGVARLVARFNERGLAVLESQHGGGQPPTYTAAERARILAEFQRQPDREQDGTATWSLTTLQRAVRQAPDGLPAVSTSTIWWVVHEAGWTWQRSRTWCQTGTVVRTRKAGPVTVHDPDAASKKN